MPVPGIVYVVDDDEAVRDSVSMLLQIHGITARTYPSGGAFLRDLAPEKNACLLIDLNMPGMTGFEVLAELQRRGIAIPAIVMSGGLVISTPAVRGRIGATVLPKPFRSGELLAHIKEALAGYRA